ncbi:MAG: GNAT family N-acetyltransferase [Myxococcales bacterium]|nr:GNAT family N-acetyltransferase [Myxococcales bacterium]
MADVIYTLWPPGRADLTGAAPERLAQLLERERALRWEVLRRPLGRPLGSERFSFEDDALHLAAVDTETSDVVGCVLFYPDPPNALGAAESGRLFQMAVRPDRQRSGLGARLVTVLEAAIRADGVRRVHLHARCAVEGFYAHLGYHRVTDEYEEVGIPHVGMEKRLR